MRAKFRGCLVLVLVGGTAACRSVRHSEPDGALIESAYANLEISDGVSRDEAVVIAQHYMLATGRDHDWFIDFPKEVADDDDRWMIVFQQKNDGWGNGPRRESELTLEMLLPYIVWVRKSDGSLTVMVSRYEP